AMTDADVARLSREHGIDIAVDLVGHTQYARPGMFAHRCAPIQINYLGYAGTMGARYIEYVVADKIVLPPDRQEDFTEKAVYLPHSYLVDGSRRAMPEVAPPRHLHGLPELGFVFCCFNTNYKIMPDMFDVWMKVLQAVGGSVLWLRHSNPTAAKN